MLYALGVGLGADALDERQLRFVYEKDLVCAADDGSCAQLPDVPTITEGGVPGYEAMTWFGCWPPCENAEADTQSRS
jgi:hypothetical protein